MNLQTGKNSISYLWPLILFAALLTGVHAQDRGTVGGGGYFVYQCPSFEESVARLSPGDRQNLQDMCLEDADVEDCVHEFFKLPSGCRMEVLVQSFEEKIRSDENLLQSPQQWDAVASFFGKVSFKENRMKDNIFKAIVLQCLMREDIYSSSCMGRFQSE